MVACLISHGSALHCGSVFPRELDCIYGFSVGSGTHIHFYVYESKQAHSILDK